MNERIRAAVLSAFAADSLALGLHWIYNTRVIDRKYGRVASLLKPELARFHAGKERGDFTHYGDQMLLLLETVVADGGFDEASLARRWHAFAAGYGGYMDKASQATLANFESGKSFPETGSDSTDLAGAARIAPLLIACPPDRPDELAAAAVAQTRLTHDHPEVLAAAELFARAACRVLGGERPVAALQAALGDTEGAERVREYVEEGFDSRGLETRQAILDLGQACAVADALPSTVHLVATYEDDLATALVENIMAGGDSAARGLLVGLLLGADQGAGAIPADWLNGMNAYPRIAQLLG